MQKVLNIGIIGAGKVATNLALSMKQSGFTIDWIWSRTHASAEKLAVAVNGRILDTLNQPLPETGMVLISLPDDAVAGVASTILLTRPETPVVHTSGSLGLEVFPRHLMNTGVFYPLQTFSENRLVSLAGIPFCIEARQPYLLELLESCIHQLGGRAIRTHAEQRLILHIAAVFACNFSNHLYTLSEEILKDSGLSFDLLHPLLKETVQKATENSPSKVQTGPAFRGDTGLIEKHLQVLNNKPELKKIYEILSRQILEKYHPDGQL